MTLPGAPPKGFSWLSQVRADRLIASWSLACDRLCTFEFGIAVEFGYRARRWGDWPVRKSRPRA
jgi:hypothetical protein